MKCFLPQIAWHSTDPILSLDFQPSNSEKCRRLATCSTDTHIMIWWIHIDELGQVKLDFRADLNRHQRTVNVVRFSNSGDLLASGDDESNIILWHRDEHVNNDLFNDDSVENKEQWLQLRVLRGHLEDICDLAFSRNDDILISGSVDNTSIVWDINKGRNLGMLSDHKGFVQGVAWDPRNAYFATLSSDRSLHVYKTSTRKRIQKISRALLPHMTSRPSKLFYDDTLKSFSRRLTFSPDGELLLAPCGIVEHEDGTFENCVYVFHRSNLSRPAYYLPVGDKFSMVVRFCPLYFKLKKCATDRPNLLDLPYRMVFAVGTQDAVLFYDTQSVIPFAHVSNIHYARISDIAWAPDASMLMTSSTEGYCSFITFCENELGDVYTDPLPDELQAAFAATPEKMKEGLIGKKRPSSKSGSPVVRRELNSGNGTAKENATGASAANSNNTDTKNNNVDNNTEEVVKASDNSSTTAGNEPSSLQQNNVPEKKSEKSEEIINIADESNDKDKTADDVAIVLDDSEKMDCTTTTTIIEDTKPSEKPEGEKKAPKRAQLVTLSRPATKDE